MALYEIQTSDGSTYQIEGADDLTQAEIEQAVAQSLPSSSAGGGRGFINNESGRIAEPTTDSFVAAPSSSKVPEESGGFWNSVKNEAGQLRDEVFSGVTNLISSTKSANTAAAANQLNERKAKLAQLEESGNGTSPEAAGLRMYIDKASTRLSMMATDAVEAGGLSDAASAMTTRKSVRDLTDAQSFGDAWEVFKKNPYDVIAGVTATSLPQMLPMIVASAINPAAGIAAAGASSTFSEFGSGIREYAKKNGVNVNNANAVNAFLQDKTKLDEALKYAGGGALIVGALDAASGGVAGKTIAPAMKSMLARQAVNIPVQATVQGAMGGAGEAGKQIYQEGEITSPGQVVAEIVGEFGGAPAEVASLSGDVRSAISERMKLESMRVLKEDTKEAVKAQPMQDLAAAQNIDEAIEAAGRAARVDANAVAEQVLAEAGIDTSPLKSPIPTVGSDELLAGVNALVEAETANAEAAPTQTEDAAVQTVAAQQEITPKPLELAAGQAIEGQPGVSEYDTPMGRVAGPTPVQRTIRDLKADAVAVADLNQGTGLAGTGLESTVLPDVPDTGEQGSGAGAIRAVAAVAESVFGTRVTYVESADKFYGVAYKGRVFINANEVLGGDGKNSIAALAISTIGHEAGHAGFEQGSIEDRATGEKYLQAVSQYLKNDAVAARQTKYAPTQEQATNEAMRDVDGAMWLDSKFWGRLYDIDNGSTFRKIAYKFMQAATKFVTAAKGSRLDINTLVTNIEVVREAAAQAWAAKAIGAKTTPRSKLKTDLFGDATYSRTGEPNEILKPNGTGRIQQDAGSNRQVSGGDRSGTPSYGKPREGAVSVVGRHYSTGQRTTLSGFYSGRGLKGAEQARLEGASSQIRSRVYFYVDTGNGIRPESGVGGYAHEVRLDNIYDPDTKLIPPQGGNNAFEEAVVKAGFDGYLAKKFTTTNGAVVLLGTKHGAVPVRYIQGAQNAAAPVSEAPSTIKKGLLSKEANAVNVDAIPGAKMRMGTLEVPADQRDAANAEMERIGSEVRYSRATEETRIGKSADREQKEPTVIVSAKPGRGFMVDGKKVKIVTYPKTKNVEFATSRLHDRAKNLLRGINARTFIESLTGAKDKSLKIGGIRGLWAGEREDTFTIQAKDMDGKPLDFSKSRVLANILGYAFLQEGAITLAPAHAEGSAIAQTPSIIIGKEGGEALSRDEVNAALSAANKAGFFGASETLDGKAIKFLFFADEDSDKSEADQYNEFVANVDQVRSATGLLGAHQFVSKSTLDEAKEYWKNGTHSGSNQGDRGEVRNTDGGAGSSDLFRGVVDNLLAPYIAEIRTEGFDFNIANWQRVFGATNEQVAYLKQQVEFLDSINKHGVVKKLRQTVSIVGDKTIGTTPVITLTTTNKNADSQLAALDELLLQSSDAMSSTDAFLRMEARAFGTNDVPMAPNRLISMLNSDGIFDQLKSLSPGQVADADHGFEAAREFRRMYENGEVSPATTAKLMLWSFLSRGVPPYVQESGFVDLVDKVEPFVQKVLSGDFNKADVEAWEKVVSATIVKGAGQPGAGTTHNANAFASSFMLNMAEVMPDGRTKMRLMHDLLSDPAKSGREIRREFVRIGEGAGIDNKVISFTLLVVGHDDVAVLDRVQIANTYNDGRLGDYNLYDGVTRYGYKDASGKDVWTGTSKEAKELAKSFAGEKILTSVQPGSGLAGITTGVRGLMIYESMENALEKKLPDIFSRLKSQGLRNSSTKPSVGRWHWESWVAYSGQEASHKTLDALLSEAKGIDNPFADVSAKEGEYGSFAYGTEYAVAKDGTQYKLYPDSTGAMRRFTLDGYRDFMAEIKKPASKVIPSKFKVSMDEKGENRSEPWFNDPRVSREKLDALIGKFGSANQVTDKTAYSRSDDYEEGFFDEVVTDEDYNLEAFSYDQPEIDTYEDVVAELSEQGYSFKKAEIPMQDFESPDTQNFKRWFRQSAWSWPNGRPRIGFHGTAQDIHAFRGKQAGAIFIAPDPEFSDNFAALSADWMRNNPSKWMEPNEFERVKKAAAKKAMAIKEYSMSTRKAMRDDIMSGDPDGEALDMLNAEVVLPSGENIVPVWVSAQNPFDYENRNHIDEVADLLFENDGIVYLTPAQSNGSDFTKDGFISKMKTGSWNLIEAPEVQAALRELAFDGFYVTEHGRKNIAVYEPTQIKSIFNKGAYSLDDERISYSRAALDTYMDGRNKAMPTISSASQQEADIALAVKAINAASTEITSGNREVLQIPIGRVPHAVSVAMPSQRVQKMMHIETSVLKKVLFDKHSEDFADVDAEAFVRAMYQPAMILKGRSDKEFEIVTSIVTKRGPILVPVTDSGTSYAIMSAYAKNVGGSGESLVKRIKSGALLYADPELAQIAVTGRSSTNGINTRGAQFPDTPPLGTNNSNVADRDLAVKPLNPYYVGWTQLRDNIIGGIRDKKVKTDLDVMKRIGKLYKGDVADAPSFSRSKQSTRYSRSQGTQGNTYTLKAESRLDHSRRIWQDYFLPVLRVQEAISQAGGVVSEVSDVYRAEERSYGRIEESLRDFQEQHFKPMMDRLVKAGLNADELALYAYAKHAPERNAHIASIRKGMPDGSGMTDAEAAAILAGFQTEGKTAALEDAHQDLMAVTNTTRLLMLDNDLITQDEYDSLQSMYSDYVPLRGLDEDTDQPVRRGGGGYNIRGKETMRALGRRSRAGDLLENIVLDYERVVSRGEKNSVAKTFLKLVSDNPDPGLWEIDAVRTKAAWDAQSGKVKNVTKVESGPDTISVKLNGKEVFVKIHDEALLRAMRKAFKSEVSGVEQFLMSTLGGFNSILRASLTQYNPVFAFTNWTRDFQMGAVGVLDTLGAGAVGKFTKLQPSSMAAAHRYVNGTLDVSNPVDKMFQEFRAAGSTTGGFYGRDAAEVKADIRGIMLAAGAAPKGWVEQVKTLGGTKSGRVALRGVQATGRMLEYLGTVSENATRFAAYRVAREAGKTPAEAASIAKNLTTNFNRKGEWGQAMNSAYLFFNAAVQGSHRVAKALKNRKVQGLMAGMVAAGAGLAALALSVGGDDDDDGQAYWDKIPDHEKERNFIIMLPPGFEMDGVEKVGSNGRFLKIPMPYGFSIFPAIGYTMSDVARGQVDRTRGISVAKGAARLTSAVMGSFNPFGGSIDLSSPSGVLMAAAPTMADVAIQQAMGRNSFDRPTAPFKSEFDADPDSENVNPRQAGSVWHLIARGLNSATGGDQATPGYIDVAPGSLENAVKTVTGGTGTFLSDVFVNLPTKAMTPNAEITSRDLPLVRNFFGKVDGMNDASLLYERRRDILKAKAALKNYEDMGLEPKNMGSMDFALAYLSETSGLYAKMMSGIRKQEIEIALDDEASKGEKATRLNELRRERDQLTREFNEAYMDVMRAERDGDFDVEK